jgi:hypothetical protein
LLNLRPCCHPQTEDAPCVVEWDPHNMDLSAFYRQCMFWSLLACAATVFKLTLQYLNCRWLSR